MTAAVNPPAGSILRAEVVPEVGGDTQWTNLVAAYEGLSEPVQAFVDDAARRAPLRRAATRRGATARTPSGSNDNLLVAIHPVVRVHPVTGEKALFVNPGFTSHIVGVSARESQAILDLLYAEITRPEYTVRLRWEPGTVAFWDNRATAHLAPRDIEHLDLQRTLHRVTLVGDVPVGPDGRESELVAGQPFTSQAHRRRGRLMQVLHFNLFLMDTGHHEASWRLPGSHPLADIDVEYFERLARLAEAATFDSVFLADSPVLWASPAPAPSGRHRAAHAADRAREGHRADRPDRHRLHQLQRPLQPGPAVRLAGPRQRRPGGLEHRHHGRRRRRP